MRSHVGGVPGIQHIELKSGVHVKQVATGSVSGKIEHFPGVTDLTGFVYEAWNHPGSDCQTLDMSAMWLHP